MSPYYDDGTCQIFHGDCREIAPTLGDQFSVVTDPPYGMAWNTDSTRFTGGQRTVRGGAGRDDWGVVSGDAEAFDPAPWLDYPAVIMFGFHHFAHALPVGTILVWIKKADHLFGSFLSDCELAWSKGGHVRAPDSETR